MKSYIISAIIILVGLSGGIATNILVIRLLKHLAAKSSWKIYKVLSIAMDKMFIIWFTLASAEFCIRYIETGLYSTILHKTIIIIAIATITILFMKMLSASLQETIPTSTVYGSSIMRFIVNLIIFLVGVTITLQILGVSITPIVTTLGVGGIAVALALQDTLSNIFAGMYILSVKQIRPGDYIKLSTGQAEQGYVVDIGWRNTTLRKLSNNLIIVPNSKLSSSIVTNYHLPAPEMSVIIGVCVSYNSDLEKVEKVTVEVGEEVLKEIEGGVKDFKPFIRYNELGEYGIKFSVILRVKEFTDQYLITHEFIKRLTSRYKKEGIEIPYPTTTVHLKTDQIKE